MQIYGGLNSRRMDEGILSRCFVREEKNIMGDEYCVNKHLMIKNISSNISSNKKSEPTDTSKINYPRTFKLLQKMNT